MKIDNKYLVVLILIVIILLIIAAKFLFKDEEPKPIIEDPVSKEHTIPARPKTYEEGAEAFIRAVRKARIAASNFDIENAEFYTRDAKIVWEDIIDEFNSRPPSGFKDKDEWSNKLENVYISINRAYELIREEDSVEEAIKELDSSRKKINETKPKEKVDDEYRLFSLLQQVKKVAESHNLEEVQKRLPELKIAYMESKNLANNEKFEDAYQNFEKILGEVDGASETTLHKYQSRLLPAFMEIYSLY